MIKNKIFIISIGSVVAFLLIALIISIKNKHTNTPIQANEKHDPVILKGAIRPEEKSAATLEQFQKALERSSRNQKTFQAKQEKSTVRSEQSMAILTNQLALQSKEIAHLKSMVEQSHQNEIDSAQNIAKMKANIVYASSNLVQHVTRKKKVRTVQNYVPLGTIVRAVVLGGADVGAGVNSQSDPSTMILRIINNGRTPGYAHSHLKDCVLIMAARGDISSERGILRSESLSCTWPNGRVSEIKVHASLFGWDGKEGMRGKPVFREGDQLQRAFWAGTLSGLAKGISQTMTTPVSLADGFRKTVMPKDVLEYSAASGMGDAMSQLAAYHIKRAELYHPILQIPAGTTVNIVFKKGFELLEGGEGA